MDKIKQILKNKFRAGFKNSIYIIISILVGVTAVYASTTTSLTPPGSASNTMYSLEDIWNLAKGTPADEGTGTIETTPTEVALSGKSLTEVYEAVATALESVGGANLSNMFNGSSSTVDGGSQTLGGVDDCNYDSENNSCGTPPTDRFETEWTPCTDGDDNYCGTGDPGAQIKDEVTGLIWSYPLSGVGGTSWDTETDPEVLLTGCPDNCAYWSTDDRYSWDSTGENNNNLTAQELCQSKGENWYLPHQKQLMQAYIDGAYGNIEPEGVYRFYWSATTFSYNTGYAWSMVLSGGYTDNDDKDVNFSVRCVRE